MRDSEGLEASRQMLHRLNALAAELETGAARSLYRFGATRAYDEVMRVRLEVIGERALPDAPTLAAFLARRLAPAIEPAPPSRRDRTISRKSSSARRNSANPRRSRARKPESGRAAHHE